MIKPNEMRIGNYVYVGIPTLRNDEFFNDKVFAIIKMVGEDRVDVQYENNGREILILDKLTPIQLNSEWLLKFGCKYSESYKGWQVLYSSGSRLIEYAECRQVFVDSSTHTELRYVHQFQNFIYALTGEELTIQEKEIGPPMMGMSY